MLLLGLDQAKVLTKTVEIQKELPNKLRNPSDVTQEINNHVKDIILSSHVFDAEQQKLPIVKDPLRPAWVFPRTYGITYSRVW